jgi:hypothetical protein
VLRFGKSDFKWVDGVVLGCDEETAVDGGPVVGEVDETTALDEDVSAEATPSLTDGAVETRFASSFKG